MAQAQAEWDSMNASKTEASAGTRAKQARFPATARLVTAVESWAGPAEIRALLAEGAYVDEIAGQVPLVWQLSRGHAAVVRLLLDGGAAVNQAMADIGGKPLFVAADGHCSRAGLPRACAMPDRLRSRCERRKERRRRDPATDRLSKRIQRRAHSAQGRRHRGNALASEQAHNRCV